MCGISGIFSFTNNDSLKYILEMTNIIHHRGPDDEGFIFFEKGNLNKTIFGGKTTPQNVFEANLEYTPKHLLTSSIPQDSIIALGHRRLSILDLSPSGHQPLCYMNESLWCVYNGEIYNYIEIRNELEKKGYIFKSNSDTEVILAAYNEWGKECLNHFNGMWSIIIVDTKRRKVFISRDRFGVKPLYYWFSPKGFLSVASEIKQFTILPGWNPYVNPQRSYDFLRWSVFDHTNETLFNNVFQIRRGEAVEFDIDNLENIIESNKLPVYQWYKLEPKSFTGTINEAAEYFNYIFHDSVKLRLRADVNVGSCLSGGLDSSAIVCSVNDILLEQNAQDMQKTFSFCSHEKKFDERDFIDEVVQGRKISANYIYPSAEDLFKHLDDIVWTQDEPFGSTSVFAQWSVFKLASENNVKVMLDGQGADEQLAGYHSFFYPFFVGLVRNARWDLLYNEANAVNQLYNYNYFSVIKWLIYRIMPNSIMDMAIKLSKTNPSAEKWIDFVKLGASNKLYITELYSKPNNIFDLSYSQLTENQLQMLLHCEDRDSMSHSIESRLPFLDYRLVEFVLGLPDEFKISNGITKFVLREGLKHTLPPKIKNRISKLGFATPEEVWVRENAGVFRTLLVKAVDQSQGILLQSSINYFDEIIDGKRPFSFFPWRLISFGKWMDKFSVKV